MLACAGEVYSKESKAVSIPGVDVGLRGFFFSPLVLNSLFFFLYFPGVLLRLRGAVEGDADDRSVLETAISDGIPLLLPPLLAQIQTPRAEGVSRCTRRIYFLALTICDYILSPRRKNKSKVKQLNRSLAAGFLN